MKPKPNQLLTVTNETTGTQPIPNYNKTKPIKVIVWRSRSHGTFDAQLKTALSLCKVSLLWLAFVKKNHIFRVLYSFVFLNTDEVYRSKC